MPGSLATISIDIADGRIVKTAGVKRDYAIMTQRWPFYRPDGGLGCISMPTVV